MKWLRIADGRWIIEEAYTVKFIASVIRYTIEDENLNVDTQKNAITSLLKYFNVLTQQYICREKVPNWCEYYVNFISSCWYWQFNEKL